MVHFSSSVWGPVTQKPHFHDSVNLREAKCTSPWVSPAQTQNDSSQSLCLVPLTRNRDMVLANLQSGSLMNNFTLCNCNREETENVLLTVIKTSFTKLGFYNSFKRSEHISSSSAKWWLTNEH